MKTSLVCTSVLTALTALAIPSGTRHAYALTAPPPPPPAGDTIAGHVTGSDSVRLKGAAVHVLALPDSEAKATTTGADGQFTIAFERPASIYSVTVTMVGYAPARRVLRHPASGRASTTIETNITMTPAAQQLSRVTTVAKHPLPPPDLMGDVLEPGETGAVIDANAVPNGDPSGDLTSALSMVPGLSAMPNADGSLDISYAGLPSDQNAVALNGMNGADNVPRDGPLLRVLTSSYDPSKGGFAGFQANHVVPAKGYTSTRTIHASLEAPPLQWTTRIAARLNPQYTRAIVSGQISNPLGSRARGSPMQNTMFQFGRETSNLISLNSAPPASLAAVGVASDSVARLLATASGLGIPVARGDLPGQRVRTSGSIMSRIDLAVGDLRTYRTQNDGELSGGTSPAPGAQASRTSFYIVAGGNWNDTQAYGTSPTAVSLRAADSRRVSGTLQANSAKQFGPAWNQLSSMFNIAQAHTSPYADLPGASVLLQSALPDGQVAYSALQAAGAGTGPSESHNWSWEAIDKLKWMAFDGQHEFQVSLDGTVDHYTISRSPSYGAYLYSSLSDFAANQPTRFSRTLGAVSSAGSGVHAALGLADTYTPQRFPSFATQYGVRIEDYGYSMRPAFNPTVDSLFGLHTDRLPNMFTVSPMAGFTWTYAHLPNGRADTRRRLAGGVRDYRSVLSTQSLDPYLRSTGLPSAMEQVQCVGDAVPIPDWGALASSPSAIPDTCAGGSAVTPLSAASPEVSVFSPDYAPSHAIRSDLTWTTPVGERFEFLVHGMEAINRDLPETYDVNFSGVTQFTLPDEAGRPVYVQPTSIVAATGAVAPSDSRVTSQFGEVNERRSDGRGHSTLVTTQLSYRPAYNPRSATPAARASIAYTYFRGNVLGNGFSAFGATTAGDPRLQTLTTNPRSRHSILLSGVFRVPTWGTISGGLRVQSGIAYTPLVNADINGDGLANDRAFVFDPATASDHTLASSMETLLATSPSWARNCLRGQLGKIAAANSCTGPWSATLNLAASFDAYRIGFKNHGTVSLSLNNALGALDQALHGDSRLHGWGQMGIADPTLLDVRGFDAAAHRFIYDVNPQFGSTAVRRAYRSPFSIVLDVKLGFGENLEAMYRSLAVRNYVVDTTENQMGIKARLMRGGSRSPLTAVIGAKQALGLSSDQVTTLSSGMSKYTMLRDSIYTDLAADLYKCRTACDTDELSQRWHDAQAAIIWAQWDAGQLLKRTLSAAQFQQAMSSGIFQPNAGWWLFDRAILEREVKGPLLGLN